MHLAVCDWDPAKQALERALRGLRGHLDGRDHPTVARAFFALARVLQVSAATGSTPPNTCPTP